MIRATTGALFLALAASAAGADPLLNLPVDCQLGETCFIQNYMDRDPGPGAADYTCARLSYDGHKGTDFALPDLAAMHAGVDVLAAAPGRVTALRDGMADIGTDLPAADLDGSECGNGVVIDHGGGWQTQYCHLREGSVTVTQGQSVAKGAPLGQVGLSGKTEFPHLHLALRHDGEPVDPFAPSDIISCDTPETSLWQTPIPYAPGGLIGSGFTSAVPDFQSIKAGEAGQETLAADAPALVFWAHIFGSRAGDELLMIIDGPEGELVRQAFVLDRTQARLFRAFGKRNMGPDWPSGTYTGTARMIRDREVIGEVLSTMTIPGS